MVFGLCLLLSLIFLFPQMRFIHPNFIDVVETWSNGTSIWLNTIAEFSNPARFWPALKFERSMLNAVFAYTPPFYFLYFSFMLATTMYVMLLIENIQKRHMLISLFSLVLLYVSPITVDTYWRLGAAETVFTLMLVLSIYAFMQKQYMKAIIFLFILMATKESAVFYVPIYLLVLFIKKRKYECAFLGMGYVLFLWKLYSLVKYAFIVSDYTSMISKSVRDVVDMGIHSIESYGFYMIVLWSAFILYLYRIFVHEYKKLPSYEWGHYFLLLNLAGLCTLVSFHNKYQPYYAFPWIVTSVMWMSWELMITNVFIQRSTLVLLGVLFLAMSIPSATLARMELWQNDYVGDNALITLIEETKQTSTYAFARSYRPEYTPALQLLSELRKWPSKELQHKTIILMTESILYSDSTPICGQTFLKASYCKWAVRTD